VFTGCPQRRGGTRWTALPDASAISTAMPAVPCPLGAFFLAAGRVDVLQRVLRVRGELRPRGRSGGWRNATGTKLSAYSENAAAEHQRGAAEERRRAGRAPPAIAVEIADASGKAVTGTTSDAAEAVNTSVVKTHDHPTAEALARSAVGQERARARWWCCGRSTGAILAVANSSGSGDPR